MNTVSSKWHFGVLALTLLCAPLAAQNAQTAKTDYSQVQAPIQRFEGFITKIINLTLPGAFAVTAKPKGFFKDDSGYTFMFTVNVSRGIRNTPFGDYADPAALNAEQKKKSIGEMKNYLMELLFAQGSAMPKMQKTMSITIAAQFEETNPIEGNTNKTVILSVLKSDIDAFSAKPQSLAEFKQRVTVIEY